MSYLEAFKKATAPVESLYWDRFSCYGFLKITLENGSKTNVPNQLLLDDIPCRVYQKARAGSSAPSEGQDPNLQYEIKLLCNVEHNIPAGSRIVVTDIHGHIKEYVRADEAFNGYITHQEVTLIRERDVTEGDEVENL